MAMYAEALLLNPGRHNSPLGCRPEDIICCHSMSSSSTLDGSKMALPCLHSNFVPALTGMIVSPRARRAEISASLKWSSPARVSQHSVLCDWGVKTRLTGGVLCQDGA